MAVTILRLVDSVAPTPGLSTFEVPATPSNVTVASGGKPTIPQLPGADLGIDSDGFFALQQLPKSCTVVGSGYIAVELAGVLKALGSNVTLVIRKSAVLRSFDTMLSKEVKLAMEQSGIEIITEAYVKSSSCCCIKLNVLE